MKVLEYAIAYVQQSSTPELVLGNLVLKKEQLLRLLQEKLAQELQTECRLMGDLYDQRLC